MAKEQIVAGYLPDERPPIGKLILFSLQQIVVMFPATVLVALLTGFHVSTTIFASGFATLCFILVTGKKIPLYYGSSFSYIAAILSITAVNNLGEIAPDNLIGQAQFGIMMSGLVSIAAGLIVSRFGQESIEKVLPATVTGSVAIIIGLSLAGAALNNPIVSEGSVAGVTSGNLATAQTLSWIICIVTLLAVVLFSVYLKKFWGQIPILLGLLVGYFVALILGLCFGIGFVDFNKLGTSGIFNFPHFTLPIPSWEAVLAIMPIAIATIPESTAHIYQLDIYVNDLAEKKGKGKYNLAGLLGLNLIGDGIGDIVSAAIGGPAGTNYGENISTMAITKNFSVWILVGAAVITMVISCFTPLINAIYSIPNAVIGGLSIYLFGVIAAQGITIMISKKVDFFDARNLAVIASILIIGIGGSYMKDGMIPMFGIKLPAIATAAIVGILLNLLLNIGRKKDKPQQEAATETAE